MVDNKKGQVEPKQIPLWVNFVIGGISGMLATSIIQPMDMLKTRMQLLGPEVKSSSVQVVQNIMKTEGIKGFYTGLSAALFRQATYSTGRFGCYYSLFDWYQKNHGVPPLMVKICFGMIAGGIGAIIGTPADVCLIRMCADGLLPPEKRRNYSNVFNALRRIIQEEGFMTLFRGVEATISRGVLVNGSQLASYSQTREMLLPSMGDGMSLHIASSLVAGFVCSVASAPADIIKTRVQNSLKKTTQEEVFMTMIKNEGVLALWNGLLPTYGRIGPYTIFSFIFLEQLNRLYFHLTD